MFLHEIYYILTRYQSKDIAIKGVIDFFFPGGTRAPWLFLCFLTFTVSSLCMKHCRSILPSCSSTAEGAGDTDTAYIFPDTVSQYSSMQFASVEQNPELKLAYVVYLLKSDGNCTCKIEETMWPYMNYCRSVFMILSKI